MKLRAASALACLAIAVLAAPIAVAQPPNATCFENDDGIWTCVVWVDKGAGFVCVLYSTAPPFESGQCAVGLRNGAVCVLNECISIQL